MIKAIFIVILSFLAVSHSYSQYLTGDSDGNSSLIAKGTSFGFATSDGTITGSVLKNPIKGGIGYGLEMRGRPTNGITNIFSEGDFNSNTELSGLISLHSYNANLIEDCASYESRLDKVIERIEVIEEERDQYYTNLISQLSDNNSCDSIQAIISILTNDRDIQSPTTLIGKIVTAYSNICPDLSLQLRKSLIDNPILSANVDKEFIKLDNEHSEIGDYIDTRKCKKANNATTLYIRPSVTNSQFTFDNGLEQFDNSAERFIDSSRMSWNISVGISHRSRNTYLGASYRIDRLSNLSRLPLSSVTLSSIDSIGGNVLMSSQTFNSRNGEITFNTTHRVFLDIMHIVKHADKGYLGFGGYLRINASDFDMTTFGMNLNLFSGDNRSFLGSFFIENRLDAGDIFGGLNFGLTTRFGLNTLFDGVTI